MVEEFGMPSRTNLNPAFDWLQLQFPSEFRILLVGMRNWLKWTGSYVGEGQDDSQPAEILSKQVNPRAVVASACSFL